jgi:hypothetical protein
MKRTAIPALLFAFSFHVVIPAHAQSTASEASAASVLATGSLVVAASTLPIVAAVSIMDAVVHSVHTGHNNVTEIRIRQDKSGQTATIRIPTNALQGKKISAGMQTTVIADQVGHTLKIEGAPIAYIPSPATGSLVHSKTVK